MNITLDMTSNYKILSAGSCQKTKPIQTQFKANKAKNKANLSQNKANSNPISSGQKMLEFTLDVSSLAFLSGAFAWIIYAIGTCAIGRSLMMIYCDFLAEFITLKGANSNPISQSAKADRLGCIRPVSLSVYQKPYSYRESFTVEFWVQRENSQPATWNYMIAGGTLMRDEMTEFF